MQAVFRAAFLAAACPLLSPAWGQALDEALARIRENVGRFEHILPDFLCSEKVTSRSVVNGKITAQVVSESTIVGALKDFIESVEIATVNGKKVSKAHTLKGPYIYLGGFSSMLIFTFGSKWTQYYDYQISGMEDVDGKSLLAIEFATKPDQNQLAQTFWHKGMVTAQRKTITSKDAGKAWIDPQSMQVLRLECRHLNLPPWVQSETVSTDYAPVTIDGKLFWMPKSTRAEDVEPTHNSKTPAYKYCIAQYRDYRKFDASAVIRY